MNKKIKIIDLFNKIANGEEIPEKIKKEELEGNSFEDLIDNLKYFNKDFSKTLNDYVEILEDNTEDNTEEIEELKPFDEIRDMSVWDNMVLSSNQRAIAIKINEIIKYIKRKEKE